MKYLKRSLLQLAKETLNIAEKELHTASENYKTIVTESGNYLIFKIPISGITKDDIDFSITDNHIEIKVKNREGDSKG